MQAATVPLKMDPPIVSLERGAIYSLSFAIPDAGGIGVEITSYEVLFFTKDRTWEPQT